MAEKKKEGPKGPSAQRYRTRGSCPHGLVLYPMQLMRVYKVDKKGEIPDWTPHFSLSRAHLFTETFKPTPKRALQRSLLFTIKGVKDRPSVFGDPDIPIRTCVFWEKPGICKLGRMRTKKEDSIPFQCWLPESIKTGEFEEIEVKGPEGKKDKLKVEKHQVVGSYPGNPERLAERWRRLGYDDYVSRKAYVKFREILKKDMGIELGEEGVVPPEGGQLSNARIIEKMKEAADKTMKWIRTWYQHGKLG